MTALDTRCWALHDGAAGNRRQALALAEALAGEIRELPLTPRVDARLFAPRLWPGAAQSLGGEFTQAQARPPTLAIGCGRQAALATRLLRAAGTRVVQILDPRLSPGHWDALVVPEHDRVRGAHVFTLRGSLHPVDDAWLAAARSRHSELALLPAPRTVVLLGGPTANTSFTIGALEVLLAKLEYALARDGGSLILCGSPRTPVALATRLRARFRDQARLWFDDADGENIFAGALAWADRLIVSPDSVNLISEACATRVPVYVAEANRARGRPQAFLADLLASGRIRAQTRELVDYPVVPLREREALVARLRATLRLD